MSLLEKASLIVTPNAYKESKLYSVVPSDGAGDMDVVRATTATRVNSAGLIESVAVNVPRIDYTNGSCPSLLVEPQRTNLLTYSEQFDDSNWTKSGLTITANSFTAPSGNLTADLITPSISDASLRQSFLPTGAVQNTFSVWLRSATGGNFSTSLRCWRDSPFTNVASTVINVTTQWQRFTFTFTSLDSSTHIIAIGADSTLSTGENCYIWGAQLEAGSYATSYIKTEATTVTRNADIISKTGISSLIGQTEGTIFLDLKDAYNGYIGLSDNSDANSVLLAFSKQYSALNFYIYANSADIIGTGFVALPSSPMKLAFKYKSGEIKLFVNGVLAYSNTSAFTFSSNLSFFGNGLYWGGGTFEGLINSEQLYKTALTDTECINLTTL